MPRCLFFILERYRRHFSRLIVALDPVTTAADRPRPTAARAWYRGATEVALLELEFDELGDAELSWLAGVARAAGVALLDPARLSEIDRKRFFSDYLAGYETRTRDFDAAEPALLALGRELHLVAGAQGERMMTLPAGPSALHGGPPRRRPSTMDMGSPMATVRGTPIKGVPSLDDLHIDVRFLRGDEWIPGRLRALNAKGLYLATGAPPRLRDLVHVALRFRDISTVVSGVVTQVTAPEHGTSGFRASFLQGDAEPRRQLVALLRGAHAAGVALSPPPPRAAIRFPVRWPLRLSTQAGHLTAAALDISTSGLFIELDGPLKSAELSFLLPLDNGEAPIRGRAQVARHVDPHMAGQRGLAAGIGVRIIALEGDDSRRYDSLLQRVRDRARHRVVVAAGPVRAHEIALALGAAGYAVSSGSDARMLVKMWELEPRQPDLVIVDDSLEPRDRAVSWLQSAWNRQAVPCLAISGDPAEAVRALADRQLRIGRGTPT